MTDNNDFSGDDLMLQLTSADPVDIHTIPGPEATSAQQLLEATIGSDADTGHVGERTTGQVRPLAKQQASRRMQFARSRTMLASAAAAVLILFGGLLVFSPNNTPSAVAAVHSAAAAADADTGRITTTFSVDGAHEDGEEHHAGGFEVEYSGSDVAFSIDPGESTSSSGLDASDLPLNEGRLVDDVLYFNDGDVWRSIDTDGLLGQMVADIVDPRMVLEKVQELTEATEVGETTIDGETVTHYQSVVDLGDESLSQSGWLGFETGDFEGEGEITVDIYVGENEILNRLDLTGAVEEGTESGTFEVSMLVTDVGSDITIEAPADAIAFDPLSMMGELELEDLDA
ncbi:MAG: hypothetical protein ACRBK7_31410 [Acidimicrobiales bacterium]